MIGDDPINLNRIFEDGPHAIFEAPDSAIPAAWTYTLPPARSVVRDGDFLLANSTGDLTLMNFHRDDAHRPVFKLGAGPVRTIRLVRHSLFVQKGHLLIASGEMCDGGIWLVCHVFLCCS